MSGCLSANSVVYLLVGLLMIFGVKFYGARLAKR
jgi:hypothetical protein